jgi:superfamily II DNA or RNA helicase
MTGLYIKELMLRGDLERCLIVAPGNLCEQWQDELSQKFGLPFEIMTNDRLESARTGNAFAEIPLVIARLDKLSRDESLHPKLDQTEWDLIVVDEAHKMSASVWGREIKYTKRYRLGQRLSRLTRHLLLLTATPHNGKEEDFQLFLALIDADRFEGRYRKDVHKVDANDLFRRMVKEQLLKFDGTPLFPERKAYTVTYQLSEQEAALYHAVTGYVREEFNRAEALAQDGRRRTVGFALTILQRRLASSPRAIYQSLKRRRERLEKRLREEKLLKRGAEARLEFPELLPKLDEEAVDDLEDAPDKEFTETADQVVDLATASQTIKELEAEIRTLYKLEGIADVVRRSGKDRKWTELSTILQDNAEMFDAQGNRRKLIIFTEHLDTLKYLSQRIRTLLGRPEAVVTISGGMRRDVRRTTQEAFLQDPKVQILVATDAAGEGINLQRAHLMVNYDLPWNPARLEQRFGRIHRIGQTEVCHLWNLVADETREGDVYRRLLEKIEEQRLALGDSVFDILGRLFKEKHLRDLLIEAVRYGDSPEVQARLFEKVDNLTDQEHCRGLLEDRALAHDSIDITEVQRIRQDFERAQARRLQPHFIEAFFRDAFKLLGGVMHEREPNRFQITQVPASVRNRSGFLGSGHVLRRYERVTFHKELTRMPGKPVADFLCPGHPLMDSVIDLILERYRGLLRRGAVLIDPNNKVENISVLVYLEHEILDDRREIRYKRRVVSKQMQFIEIDEQGHIWSAGPAPFLDYQPVDEEDMQKIKPLIEAEWLKEDIESQAKSYAVQYLVQNHFEEVRKRRQERVARTRAAVKDRLTKEISYWDNRALELKAREQAGKKAARLNSEMARRRADDLAARLQKRLGLLDQEERLSTLPPVVIGGAIVVPIALLRKSEVEPGLYGRNRSLIEEAAMKAVMDKERKLGYLPRDVSKDKLGWDVESTIPGEGRLRFIEVKGRIKGASTVTVSKNEILAGLNKPDDFILALAEVEIESKNIGSKPEAIVKDVHYVHHPFQQELDFAVTSVNFDVNKIKKSP